VQAPGGMDLLNMCGNAYRRKVYSKVALQKYILKLLYKSLTNHARVHEVVGRFKKANIGWVDI